MTSFLPHRAFKTVPDRGVHAEEIMYTEEEEGVPQLVV
jgi:hypothetical protein